MRRWFVFRQTLGFTQAELMITVAVMGILAAIAVPSLSPWMHQQQVNAALNQIDQALQETQNEAIKRNKSCQVTLKQGTNATVTGDCFVSGPRTLKDITLVHNRGPNDWIIEFDAQGANLSPINNPGTLWLSAANAQPKCMVISVGIGLRRTGLYRNNTCVTP